MTFVSQYLLLMKKFILLFHFIIQMPSFPRFLYSGPDYLTIIRISEGSKMEQSSPFLTIHKVALPHLLSFTIDIGVFFAIYQYRKYPLFFHVLICMACALATLVSSIYLIINHPFPSNGYLKNHAIIGIFVMISIFVQVACGMVSKVLQCTSHSQSFLIYVLNRIHKINGYCLLMISKFSIYYSLDNGGEKAELWMLFSFDAILLILLVIRKIKIKHIQYVSIPQIDNEEDSLQLIENLTHYGKEEIVGIFANYVFNIEPLMRFHPMGFEIIESVRGREFDRYLYGSAPTERLFKIPPNNHSLHSIKLLGRPLAKIHILPIYQNLEKDIQSVKIKQLVQISPKGHLYEVRLLQANGKGFRCRGYSSINQIGRYFVLNLDHKVSRLYITVSFLAPRNIELLSRIYFQPINQTIYSIAMNPFNFNSQDEGTITTERQLREQEKEDYLPLYIKKYPGGILSAPLIQQSFTSLQLSTQRGQGLQLYKLIPGKVVIFIGGTGIIPFGDLIDLLFKAILIKTHPQFKQLIIFQNPILGTDSLKGFSFKFFLEEHYYQDIHPLTRAQLMEVTKYPELLQFHLKCHEKIVDAKFKRSNIKFVDQQMQEIVRREISNESYEEISQYWICCSPTMSAKIIQIFDEKKVPDHKFVFL